MKFSKSKLTLLAGAVTISILSGCAGHAFAYGDQPNMEAALSALQTAQGELQRAPPNKGGHRGAALIHVQEAIREVRLGIDYADGYRTPPPR